VSHETSHLPRSEEVSTWTTLPNMIAGKARRKNEDDDQWRERAVKVLQDLELKEALQRQRAAAKAHALVERHRKKAQEQLEKLLNKRRESLDSSTLVNIEAVFRVVPEQQDLLMAPVYEIPEAALRYHASAHKLFAENAWLSVRRAKDTTSSWVLDTLTTKASEAKCDLNCPACHSVQALACATSNLGPIGSHLETHLPYGYAGDSGRVFSYITERGPS